MSFCHVSMSVKYVRNYNFVFDSILSIYMHARGTFLIFDIFCFLGHPSASLQEVHALHSIDNILLFHNNKLVSKYYKRFSGPIFDDFCLQNFDRLWHHQSVNYVTIEFWNYGTRTVCQWIMEQELTVTPSECELWNYIWLLYFDWLWRHMSVTYGTMADCEA